jgi:hypothetical protein
MFEVHTFTQICSINALLHKNPLMSIQPDYNLLRNCTRKMDVLFFKAGTVYGKIEYLVHSSKFDTTGTTLALIYFFYKYYLCISGYMFLKCLKLVKTHIALCLAITRDSKWYSKKIKSLK